MRFKFLAFLLCISYLQADPWGKDADLAFAQESCRLEERQYGLGVALSNLLIAFHQEVISPADGPRSHYYPSSSQYTLEAINKYGFFKGWMLGCDRLLRENDEKWVYREIITPSGSLMKWDPVP